MNVTIGNCNGYNVTRTGHERADRTRHTETYRAMYVARIEGRYGHDDVTHSWSEYGDTIADCDAAAKIRVGNRPTPAPHPLTGTPVLISEFDGDEMHVVARREVDTGCEWTWWIWTRHPEHGSSYAENGVWAGWRGEESEVLAAIILESATERADDDLAPRVWRTPLGSEHERQARLVASAWKRKAA